MSKLFDKNIERLEKMKKNSERALSNLNHTLQKENVRKTINTQERLREVIQSCNRQSGDFSFQQKKSQSLNARLIKKDAASQQSLVNQVRRNSNRFTA
jgi:hypothetical protein